MLVSLSGVNHNVTKIAVKTKCTWVHLCLVCFTGYHAFLESTQLCNSEQFSYLKITGGGGLVFSDCFQEFWIDHGNRAMWLDTHGKKHVQKKQPWAGRFEFQPGSPMGTSEGLVWANHFHFLAVSSFSCKMHTWGPLPSDFIIQTAILSFAWIHESLKPGIFHKII